MSFWRNGSRASLRCWCRKASGFDSPEGHQVLRCFSSPHGTTGQRQRGRNHNPAETSAEVATGWEPPHGLRGCWCGHRPVTAARGDRNSCRSPISRRDLSPGVAAGDGMGRREDGPMQGSRAFTRPPMKEAHTPRQWSISFIIHLCVAQSGRALGPEPRGRRIEACRIDHYGGPVRSSPLNQRQAP